MGELLPCPFCGSTALADDVSRFLGEARWAVECENEDCWARTKDYAEQSEAIAAWNKRACIEALEQRREVQAPVKVNRTKLAEAAIIKLEKRNG